MAVLCNRCGHYIFALWFLFSFIVSFFLSFFLSFFFSSHNLSGRRVDVYHTSTHGVALVRVECRSEMCCTRLAGNAGRKNDAKTAILASSHNFVGLNLRNSEKKLLNSNISSTCEAGIGTETEVDSQS